MQADLLNSCLKNPVAAEHINKRIVAIAEKDPKTRLVAAEQIVVQAVSDVENGNYKQAEIAWQRAAAIYESEQEHGKTDDRETRNLLGVGRAFMQKDQFEAADAVLRSAMKFQHQGQLCGSPRPCEIVEAYLNENKFDDAKALVDYMVTLTTDKGGALNEELVPAARLLITAYAQAGKHDLARAVEKSVLTACEPQLGKNSPRLEALGMPLLLNKRSDDELSKALDRRDYAGAEKEILAQIHTLEAMPKSNSIRQKLKELYHRLADTDLRWNRYDKLEWAYRRLRDLVLTEQDTDPAAYLNCIADALEKQGKFAEAAELHKKCVDYHTQKSELSSLEFDLLSLGAVYEKMGQKENALKQYDYGLRKCVSGRYALGIRRFSEARAGVLQAMGKTAEAQSIMSAVKSGICPLCKQKDQVHRSDNSGCCLPAVTEWYCSRCKAEF